MRIDPQQAASRITGQQTPGKRKAKGATPPLAFIRAHGEDADCPAYYEFCQEDGSRVLAPADDELPPVLAIHDKGKGSDMPPAMVEWLQGYEQEIEWYQAVGCNLTITQQPTGSNPSQYAAALPQPTTEQPQLPAKAPQSLATVGPLIACHWHQTAPYNQMTVFGDVACMTGCWATAIAQLLFYWGCQQHDGKYYRRGCMPTDPYKTRTMKQAIDGLPGIAIFDYDNMPATKPATAAQKAAVAQMMLYCGCAMKMDYAPGGSAAYISDLPAVLQNKLRMGKPVLVNSTKGAAAFEQRIIDDLQAGRPVLFRGSGSDGGHAFICDGYNPASGLFHFNWGWGGKYDGWFALSALTPSHYEFSTNKKAVVNIQPTTVWGDVDGDGKVSVEDAYAIRDQILKGRKNEAGDINFDGDVNVTDMMLAVKESLKKEEQ